MKALIVYYSYSGTTEKTVSLLKGILEKAYAVTVERLRPRTEIHTFIGQCNAAFRRRRAELEGAPCHDTSAFDMIVIASPVWAFAPVPALNTYLDRMTGLTAKKAVILLTSGSGAGVTRCFKTIRHILKSKGAASIVEINIPNRIMNDEAAVLAKLRKSL